MHAAGDRVGTRPGRQRPRLQARPGVHPGHDDPLRGAARLQRAAERKHPQDERLRQGHEVDG